MDFEANYLGFEASEIIEFLLKATSQERKDVLNSDDLLSYLKLNPFCINFKQELPECAKEARALLSYPEKIIAVDSTLKPTRRCFSLLHEIGHYVLPSHVHRLYLCDQEDLGWNSEKVFEKEANDFAANLLFLGNRFLLEANSALPSAQAIKQLSQKYNASFECTARHFVEKNFHLCMFISFLQNPSVGSVDVSGADRWNVRYCVGSPSFKVQYFQEVNGSLPDDVTGQLVQSGRDIADSIYREVVIKSRTNDKAYRMKVEYFYNQYNIFALVVPLQSK